MQRPYQDKVAQQSVHSTANRAVLQFNLQESPPKLASAMSHFLTATLARVIPFGLGLSAWLGVAAAPAQAGRYVLNQSFETIEQYFGPHLTETIQQRENEVWTERYYSNAGLRRALPTFPQNFKLKVVFVDGRAQWIVITSAIAPEMPSTEDPEWASLNYNEAAASNFFQYVFQYRPSTYERVPNFYGGGHEGFYINRLCLGDGIETSYAESGLGISDISLSYTPECEP